VRIAILHGDHHAEPLGVLRHPAERLCFAVPHRGQLFQSGERPRVLVGRVQRKLRAVVDHDFGVDSVGDLQAAQEHLLVKAGRVGEPERQSRMDSGSQRLALEYRGDPLQFVAVDLAAADHVAGGERQLVRVKTRFSDFLQLLSQTIQAIAGGRPICADTDSFDHSNLALTR
jgi:hypothetical protein